MRLLWSYVLGFIGSALICAYASPWAAFGVFLVIGGYDQLKKCESVAAPGEHS